MTSPSCRDGFCPRYGGFSLLELICVIAVVLVISVLGFGAFQKIGVAQKEMRCISNLRVLGEGMQSYILDCNNVLYSMHGGADVRDMWVRKLLMGGYLNPQAERSDLLARENAILTAEIGTVGKFFRCPTGKIEASFIPYDTHPRRWGWQAYGMGMYAPEGTIEVLNVPKMGNTGFFRVSIASIESPSNYILFADSANNESDGYQDFKISKSLGHSGGIALRHRGFANAVFLDGHIERVDRQRAIEARVPPEKIFHLKE